VLTYATTNWTVDTQISYQNNGTTNELNLGDIVRIDGSLQYRLIPKKLTVDTEYFINGVFELNIIDQQDNNLNGKDADNGSTQVFIAPGMQYINQNWIAEASVQLPLNDSGTAFETDYIARIGIRKNF